MKSNVILTHNLLKFHKGQLKKEKKVSISEFHIYSHSRLNELISNRCLFFYVKRKENGVW